MRFVRAVTTGLMLAMLPCLAWAANLTVTVKDPAGAAIAGADVAAISFSSMGPVASSLVQTDGSGTAVLPLTSDLMYQIVAVKEGCLPSARDQMFNWTSSINAGTANATKEIQLRAATAADKTRDIKVTVTHSAAAGNMLFINLMNKGTYEPAGMGFFKSAGAGTVVCYVYGAPVSDDQNYPFQLDVFDPSSRMGNRIGVNNPAGAGINDVGTLNIGGGGGMAPPTRQVVTDEKMGDIAFEGVVKKAEDGAGIEGVNIDIHDNSSPNASNIHTQTDENGYFAFYQSADTANPIFVGGHDYSVNFMKQGRVGSWRQKTYANHRTTMTVTMSLATGKIKGIVNIVQQDSTGNIVKTVPIPQAMVNAWNDGMNYSVQNSTWMDFNPGMGNASEPVAKGRFLLEGLPSGRYQINIWSEFNNQPVNYNWGADGVSASGSNMGGGQGVSDWKDDLIVEIATMTSLYPRVYSAKTKAPVVNAGDDIVINMIKRPDGTNAITGTVTFVGTTSEIDPGDVLIIARQDYASDGVPPKSGFTVLQAADKTAANTYAYSITGLAEGTYRLEVKAANFGMKFDQDARTNENIVLGTGGKTSTTVNIKMAPAGVIQGFLRTPKGTIFIPSFGADYTGAWIDANSDMTNSWGSGQVDKDGKFKIEGVLPGQYSLRVNGNGSGYTYASATLQNVNVEANSTTSVEIPLRTGVRVRPVLSEQLPAEIAAVVQQNQGDMKIVFTPANEPLTAKNIDEVFRMGSGGGNMPNVIYYWGGSFQQVAIEPGAYNFYLTFEKRFPQNAENYSKCIIGRARNVVVDSSKQTDQSFQFGSSVTVQNIPLAVTVGTGTFSGTYAGVNTLRDADMAVIEKNFNLFLSYVPRVTLMDNDGNILATGMCTPAASIIMQLEGDKGGQGDSGFISKMREYMSSLSFGIAYLRPQASVKAVITTPNYPPLMRNVSISGTLTVNMDTDVGAGANITGAVRTAAGAPIVDATVRIRGRLLDRTVKTQADGSYLIPGLATGGYRLLVSADGYALDAEKVNVGTDNKLVNFVLTPCAGSISGTVYSQKFPYPLAVSGAKIVAYDDTANGLNPTKELAIYETVSANDGTYTIKPVIEGHTFKVALVVPGKSVQLLSAAVPATAGGAVTGIDFTYKSTAPKIKIVARPNADGTVTIAGESPKKLVALTAKANEGATYSETGAVATTVTKIGDKSYTVTLADKTKAYTVRFSADDGASIGTLDVVYNPNSLAQATANIDQEIVASGDIQLDSQGNDTSGLYISPGSITLGDNSIPSISMQKEKRDGSALTSGLPSASLASDIYRINLTMDGSQQNENKTMTLTVGYDPLLVGQDLSVLGISQYNATTGAWDPISGSPMVDPINGTVSMEVKSVTDAAGTSPSSRKYAAAQFNGKEYKITKKAPAATQQGIFIVSRAAAVAPTRTYSGSELEVFNTPNPFNLKSKTINLAAGASATTMTVDGTIIRFGVPTSLGLNVKAQFRIYNIAGELVRELDARDLITGNIDGGNYYYLEWNGRNTGGEKCASGVYLCVAEIGTVKKTIKMALVK